ncbi:MAG: OFA family MFS transporter [Tenacibaculum sp.]|nr:OFA family MFS transporter [Tenacibaculum sp.]
MDVRTAKKKAWRVLIAGIISNLSIGILYTWSNLRDALAAVDPATGERIYSEWAPTMLNLPYSVGGFLSAFVVVAAGAWQDRVGAKKVIIVGILMVSLGAILSSFVTHSPYMFLVTFGIIVGSGIGFVYACPRAAAMKWFHPSKKGMVNGLVVAGFGLGALWLGPVEIFLLKTMGLSLEQTLLALGVLILCIGIPAAMNVIEPKTKEEKEIVDKIRSEDLSGGKPVKATMRKADNVSLATCAKYPQTWMLLTIYSFFCSAGALVISNATDIMRIQTGGPEGPFGETVIKAIAFMVPLASISNATGRSLGGILSDKIGRKPTYYIIHTVAALNMLGFIYFWKTPYLVVLGVILACVAYGSAMSTTPSIVADYFGLKNYGANYGLVYNGWGISLIIGPSISAYSKYAYGNYDFAYAAAIVLIAISAAIVFFLKQPKFKPEEIIRD